MKTNYSNDPSNVPSTPENEDQNLAKEFLFMGGKKRLKVTIDADVPLHFQEVIIRQTWKIFSLSEQVRILEDRLERVELDNAFLSGKASNNG